MDLIPSNLSCWRDWYNDVCHHSISKGSNLFLVCHLTLRVLFFRRGSSFWTWRARVPKPRDCRDSVMKRCVGETHSISSSLALPPGGEDEERGDWFDFITCIGSCCFFVICGHEQIYFPAYLKWIFWVTQCVGILTWILTCGISQLDEDIVVLNVIGHKKERGVCVFVFLTYDVL